MVKQNIFRATSHFSIIVIVLAISPSFSAETSSPYLDKTKSEIEKLAARDAITIGIREVKEIRRFIKKIPRLKSVTNKRNPDLLNCVDYLVSDMRIAKSTLHRLRHLNHPNLISDADSLKKMIDRSIQTGKVCYDTIKNVDHVIMMMLVTKLKDLSTAVENVCYHVRKYEKGESKV